MPNKYIEQLELLKVKYPEKQQQLDLWINSIKTTVKSAIDARKNNAPNKLELEETYKNLLKSVKTFINQLQ